MGAAAAVESAPSQVLVDASAFDRLSLAELEAIAARAALLVSPLSLWEILSHIDEPRHSGEGGACAATVLGDRLCKCEALGALADPLAERAPFDGLAAHLDELCQELRDGRPPAEVAGQARRALEEARGAHARRAVEFCGGLAAQLGAERLLALSGCAFVRQASEEVAALARECRELGVSEPEPALEGSLFSSVYPFAGYRLARAQERLRRSRGRPGPPAEADDLEDEHLCRHLDLLEPRALVTADPAARAALDRALAQLVAASRETGAGVVALTRAMSVDEVVREFPAGG